MINKNESRPFGKISKPAERALANAGINTLEELARRSESELMKLHGMGKTTLPILRAALADKGLSFTQKG
jgi:DNA-directed RNA polymerase alpha subunit